MAKKKSKKKVPVLYRYRWPVASVSLIFSLLVLMWFFWGLPAPSRLVNNPPPLTTKILDRNGKLLYNIYTDENRTIIPLSAIPQNLQKATIAVEDKDFYRHHGINVAGGILRAIKDMIFRQQLQGGSTITQQLIKISLLTPKRTIDRKIKEAVLALWVERIFDKKQILAMYLNRVPYGGTAYGIEEAAQQIFGIHARDLSLSQSALLAGLPQAPTFYSPFGTDPSRAKQRQIHVLTRMYEDKYISKEELDTASKEPLVYATASSQMAAPHFVAYVKEQLAQKFGEETMARDGLKVTTTVDLDLQQYAQATVSSEVEKQRQLKVGNGAALVTNPSTGEILAMVGSADYLASGSGNVNVTLALRSPGSSIKPLNYALGFLKGNSNPATAWVDVPYCFPPFNGKTYCPQNYDGKFHGIVQTRFALGNSLNIPAVKQLAINKMEDFIATASAMGLTTLTEKERFGYSLTLGGGEVKMVDMAVAFGVLANSGRKQNLISILKVEDTNGQILFQSPTANHQPPIPWNGAQLWTPHEDYVLPAEVTYLISHILLDDSSRAMTFGAGSVLNIPGHTVSVKTGTTEDKRDNWTIGYSFGPEPRLISVWVGNNDNSPMSPYLESGNTGAAPIWNKIFRQALKNIPNVWPQKPENIVFMEICNLSGLLPDRGCPVRGEYFIKGLAPTQKDNTWDQKRKIWVFKDTKKQATGNFLPEQVEEQDHLVISDPLQKDICAGCPL